MKKQNRHSSRKPFGRRRSVGSGLSSGQAGVVLLILIMTLAVMMIVLTAAMPNYRFENKREREEDLLAKGNEIANAIERFRRQANRYPLSMEELVDGITIGVKQVHFARGSAAKDPMTNGDWHLIRQGDPALLDFAEAWSSYTMQPIPASLANLIGVQLNATTGQPTTGGTTTPGSTTPPTPQTGLTPSGDVGDGTVLGPFVGVSSTSKEQSARLYYGLDEYDKWVFIYLPPTSTVPGVPIVPLQTAPGSGTGTGNGNRGTGGGNGGTGGGTGGGNGGRGGGRGSGN